MRIVASSNFFESIKKLGSLKNKCNAIRMWFKYHIFSKGFYKLLKTLLKGYPYDKQYLYELEREKIKEMIAYHERVKRYEGVEYDIRDMKICVKLIDIFLDELNLYHYDGCLKFCKIEGCDDYEMNGEDLKYSCDVKVNLKNIDRFVDNKFTKKWCEKYPHELYMKKAKHLYHKIRLEKDESWWD